MFNINDTVMYRNAGVCKIADIRTEKFGGEETLYYILKPVEEESSTIYCPVHSDTLHLRRLLSLEEIDALIQAMPDTETEWIENDQLRREKYSAILRRGDHRQLVGLIKTLYSQREEKQRQGRKFHLADEKIMTEAETTLYGEFAHVLHIQPSEVIDYIVGALEPSEPQADPAGESQPGAESTGLATAAKSIQ